MIDIIILILIIMYTTLVHISLIKFKTYTTIEIDRFNERTRDLEESLNVHSERDFFEHRDIYARIDLYHPVRVESNPEVYSFTKKDIKNRNGIECLDDLKNETIQIKALNYIYNSKKSVESEDV